MESYLKNDAASDSADYFVPKSTIYGFTPQTGLSGDYVTITGWTIETQEPQSSQHGWFPNVRLPGQDGNTGIKVDWQRLMTLEVFQNQLFEHEDPAHF